MSKRVNLELNVDLVEYMQRVLILDEEKKFDRLDKGLDNGEYLASLISINRMIQIAIEDVLHPEDEVEEKDVKRNIGFKVGDKKDEKEEEIELEEDSYDDPNRQGFIVPPSTISNNPEDDYDFYINGEDL